ncbi:MAG: toprim domain-containing protein [Candidatus Aenigmatarchaeota archaeon]|nr:MAG: toprim domain-containing protein [Candidatus Aenigmarchaeota archaeon]
MNKVNGRELSKCIQELEGKLVIVEGQKDSKSLKSLGVKNIMQLNGKPLAEFTFHVSKSLISSSEGKREVVILTDFDSEGRKIAAKLESLFRVHKVAVNARIRRKFMQFGKNRIEDFKEGDIYGKVSSHFNKIRDKGQHKGQRSH